MSEENALRGCIVVEKNPIFRASRVRLLSPNGRQTASIFCRPMILMHKLIKFLHIFVGDARGMSPRSLQGRSFTFEAPAPLETASA